MEYDEWNEEREEYGPAVIRPGKDPVWIGASMLAVLSAVVFFMVLIFGVEMDRLTVTESNLIRTDVIQGYLNNVWILGLGLFALCAAAIVLSVWKCGEKYEDGRVHLTWFDRIFSDVLVVGGILVGCVIIPAYYFLQGWIMLTMVQGRILPAVARFARAETLKGLWQLSDNYYSFIAMNLEPHWVLLFFGLLFALVTFGAELLILQAIAKQVKNRIVLKNTLTWLVISHVYRGIRNLLVKTDKNGKLVVAILIIGALICATWVGAVAVIALILWKVPGFMRKYMSVKKGIHELCEGNLDYQIDLPGDGEMERLAAEVNQISGARKLALEKELRSQRLKTDLISNVSHDLKTPLTSMVTYVDLLKKEGLDSGNAPEYLRILDEKTNRLQKLSVDLFEAAKASSGDIPVQLETVDAAEIVNQALAELDSNLRDSGLQMIVTRKTEQTSVRADGRLLWRVLENVFTNVAKYAVPGSRAYVDLTEARGRCIIEVKNMSRDPLNIDADELMERFKRGDDSRSTEGSGLGLAIANDLTRLMGGNFRILIDGDLFKAVIELERA